MADDPIFQTWAAQSRIRRPRRQVRVVRDSPSGAYTQAKKGVIHFYQPGVNIESWAPARPLFYHEEGHVYDSSNMTPKRRAIFRNIMGAAPHQKWWKGANPLGEQFAQGYSLAAQGAKQMNGPSKGYGYNPTKRQQRQVRRMIVGKPIGHVKPRP